MKLFKKKVITLVSSDRQEINWRQRFSIREIVARLEEKLELLEQTEKYFQDIYYITFDKLHMLVRIDSFKRTCEHCQYIDRKEAKLEAHLLIKLNHTCEIVVVWKNLPYGIPQGGKNVEFIRLSRGAQPRGKVWWPEGLLMSKFLGLTLNIFR